MPYAILITNLLYYLKCLLEWELTGNGRFSCGYLGARRNVWLKSRGSLVVVKTGPNFCKNCCWCRGKWLMEAAEPLVYQCSTYSMPVLDINRRGLLDMRLYCILKLNYGTSSFRCPRRQFCKSSFLLFLGPRYEKLPTFSLNGRLGFFIFVFWVSLWRFSRSGFNGV